MKAAAFAAATFLGAFLLFQVQPLIAKFILPWFGGATSVWTTCMLFFQVLLLLGYAYAHALARIKRPYVQVIVHLFAVVAAISFLPIAPSEQQKPADVSDPTWRILELLFSSIGGPYLVLAATSPLIQAWFYRASSGAQNDSPVGRPALGSAGLQTGQSPYRLYALSNIGSLLALITFPFLFEPLLSRKLLSILWSCGFVAFGIISVCSGLAVWRLPPATPSEEVVSERSPWWMWILLPAAGSIMLLATTNKICQDIAVVPFLWILPLALYLLTFIIAFDNPRWYRRGAYLVALVICSAAVCAVLFTAPNPPLALQITAFCGLLFVYCMVCHGELYRLKPHPSQLTAFYLFIAFGGAAGGIFVGLIAPLIFNNYLEFHLGMLLAPLLVAFLLQREGRRVLWKVVAGFAVALAFALAEHVVRLNKDVVAQARNFYGVLRVFEYNTHYPEARFKRMNSGDIAHGEQFVAPSRSMLPTTYYVDVSGVGRALRAMPPGGRRVGAVGLGVGTLAAYAHAGDTFRFYEINPASKRFAETHFTYLLRATGAVHVVLGDARLSLEREPQQHYDLLVLDAFSGDSVPVHLLTREAFEIYLRHLRPNGVLAVHVTNRHLDLVPVVQKLAQHHKLEWKYIAHTSGEVAWHYQSMWMLLSRDTGFLDHDLIRTAAQTPETREARLWTDDYASLLPLLKYESR